jgi:hypothetical protein
MIWRGHTTVTPKFAEFLDKMVCYDFRQRYASATLALNALQELITPPSGTIVFSPAAQIYSIKPEKSKKTVLIKLALGIFLLRMGEWHEYTYLTTSILVMPRNHINKETHFYNYKDMKMH